jgi:DNA polymerase II small subunit/DNA polymerase delta subunit B
MTIDENADPNRIYTKSRLEESFKKLKHNPLNQESLRDSEIILKPKNLTYNSGKKSKPFDSL